MVDFSYVTALKADKQIEYPLYELGEGISLTLRSANEGNTAYMNGLLRLTGQTGGSARKPKLEVNAALLDDMRELDKQLYPGTVITGWSGIQDSEGKDVPFTSDACTDFLKVLPHWILDGIRTFATSPANFAGQIDSAAKAKNSQEG